MLVEAVGTARPQREDAEGLAPGDDRHQHQRARPDSFDRQAFGAEVLELGQVLVRDRPQQQRLGVLEHVCDLPRLVREREAGRERLEHRLRRRIGSDTRHPGEHAVAEQIDVAGVGQPRHAHVRDPRCDLVLLERGREELAGLREQA